MIGLDTGTTNSKGAFVDANGKPVSILNARGERATPSVVYRDSSGGCLVGTDAWEKGLLDPKGFVPTFKLSLGSTESLLPAGTPFTPTDAAAVIISELKANAERQTGDAVTQVVLTCPAVFSDDAKQALVEGAGRSGIEVLLVMPEPTAASYAYVVEKGFDDDTILVFDFGGGTLDVSILVVHGSEQRVLATHGDSRLGGNDINQVILERILDEVEKASRKRPDPQKDHLFFLEMGPKIENAKRSLASQQEVPIVASHRGKQAIVKLTREWFVRSTKPLLDRAMQTIDGAMQGAGIESKTIDRVLLVGGTSRMPLVQERVADHLGIVPHTDIDPDMAVVFGAALASVHELDKRGQRATIHGQVIPSPKVTVRDVTAHGVGCCVLDTSGPAHDLVNAVVIEKNTPIPCSRTERFMLQHDSQTAARIEVLQGAAEAKREDCCVIGEIVLEGLPPEPKRTERIEVEYQIDANGMVTATATDKISGKSQTISVDYKKGIRSGDRSTAA